MELDEGRGYSLPYPGEKYLCRKHIEDPYLQQFIRDNSSLGECTYCGRKRKVIDLRDFLKYTAGKITEYYSDPQHEGLWLEGTFYDDVFEEIPGFKRVGGYIAPSYSKNYESTRELLWDIELISDNPELDEDIENCFIRDSWIKRYATIMSERQELSVLWELFSSMVKHQQRFTFFKRPEFTSPVPSGDNELLDILTELSDRISKNNLIVKIPLGTELYRCRFYNPSKETVSNFEDITSPPNDIAKQSRMSPAGISMFYGAYDYNTAVIESSPDGKNITSPHITGRFITTKALKILDLTALPHISFWMNGDREGMSFLSNFREQITKPVKRDDRIHVEYIPSQIFTEYLRYIFRTKYNRKIDGIKYPSSLGRAANIVLFYNNRTSSEILKLKELR